MRPSKSILDESFSYVPSTSTSVADTWRRFGWHPPTDDERARQRRSTRPVAHARFAALKLGGGAYR
jgi:hypothetical protein